MIRSRVQPIATGKRWSRHLGVDYFRVTGRPQQPTWPYNRLVADLPLLQSADNATNQVASWAALGTATRQGQANTSNGFSATSAFWEDPRINGTGRPFFGGEF